MADLDRAAAQLEKGVRAEPTGPGPFGFVVAGSIAGLAWAAGLRGMMTQIAGPESTVHWVGTFVWVLAPGLLTGLLLGWAEYLRRTGGRRGWRWLALAPLIFSAVLFSSPTDMGALLEDGIGGGAIGVPLIGMAGGYAISGRGRLWGRIACGVVALAPIPIWALTAQAISPELALDTPRGAWVAVYYYSFLAVLAFACAIPHRPTLHRAAD